MRVHYLRLTTNGLWFVMNDFIWAADYASSLDIIYLATGRTNLYQLDPDPMNN